MATLSKRSDLSFGQERSARGSLAIADKPSIDRDFTNCPFRPRNDIGFGTRPQVEFWQAEPEPSTQVGLVEAYVKTVGRWQLSKSDRIKLLGLAGSASLADQIMRGLVKPFSDDIIDRMSYVIGISLGLGAVFGEDLRAEIAWLNFRNPAFGGSAPVDFMLRRGIRNLIKVFEVVRRLQGLA